jgi:hypothetical protein
MPRYPKSFFKYAFYKNVDGEIAHEILLDGLSVSVLANFTFVLLI